MHVGSQAGRDAPRRVAEAGARTGCARAAASLRIDADAPFATDIERRPGFERRRAAASGRHAWPRPGRWSACRPARRSVARGTSIDAKATLLPFAAWPLPALDATTRGLDVAALVAGAPATSIDARVHVDARAVAAGAHQRRGRRTTHRAASTKVVCRCVGYRSTASARPDQPQRLNASTVAIEFADAMENAGPLRWTHRARRRAPATRRAHRQAATATARLARSAGRARRARRCAHRRTRHGQSLRPADHARRPASAGAQGGAAQACNCSSTRPASDRHRAARMVARSGDASAELSGRLQRPDAKAFVVNGKARLDRFDPRPFWTGRADSPLARGPHRVNAQSTFDLRIALPDQPSVDAWLAAIDGNAMLKLADSVLAGVPVSADLSVRRKRRARLQGRLALDAGGNRARIKGSGQRRDAGAADRWQLELDAPALGALAPLVAADSAGRRTARWHSPARSMRRRPSSAAGRASQAMAGRPCAGCAFGDIALARTDARWNVGGAKVDAPLDVQIDLSDGRFGREGPNGAAPPAAITLGEHAHRRHAGVAPHRGAGEQPVASAGMGGRVGRGADRRRDRRRACARKAAHPRPAGAAASSELRLGAAPRNGATASGGAAAGAWLALRDLKLALQLDADDASSDRGRASSPAAPRCSAHAGLAAHRLAHRSGRRAASRRSPRSSSRCRSRRSSRGCSRTFGWSGDLKIGAHIDVQQRAGRSAPTSCVAAQRRRPQHRRPTLAKSRPIARRSARPVGPAPGAGGARRRLALLAGAGRHDVRRGRRRAKPAPARRRASGRRPTRRSKACSRRRWPTSASGARGCRPAGASAARLRTSASIGGRFGAPEYTGRVSGRQLAVRNMLEGVNVRDGEVDVALQGADGAHRALRRAGPATAA